MPPGIHTSKQTAGQILSEAKAKVDEMYNRDLTSDLARIDIPIEEIVGLARNLLVCREKTPECFEVFAEIGLERIVQLGEGWIDG